MKNYLIFIFKNVKFPIFFDLLVKSLTSLVYIYLSVKLQLFINSIEQYQFTEKTFLFIVLYASLALILSEIMAVIIHLIAYRKIKEGLLKVLIQKSDRLNSQTPSLRGRAITHIIDTVMEPAEWLSIPCRITIILVILYTFSLPLLWPLMCSMLVLLLTFFLSHYHYQLSQQTVDAIDKRSKFLQRFVKRQRVQSTWFSNKISLAFRKESAVRNKGTVVEELSQQLTFIIVLLYSAIFFYTGLLPKEQLLIFILSTGMISSIIAEFTAAAGIASKTAKFFNLLMSETEGKETDQLWAGSLASNTLMHDDEYQCHQLFEALFGAEFVQRHQHLVAIEKLSTAQKNAILSIRNSWQSKSSTIPKKYQQTMDKTVYRTLSENLVILLNPIKNNCNS